jgi:hypothetical protein
MGLIAPPEKAEPKQLSEGDGIMEADVEEVSPEEAANIPEAELLSEFDKLEGKRAEG